jgi:prophage regulatory protein
MAQTNLRILRLRSVTEKTGVARSSIYKAIGRGVFIRPISLGGRSIGWPLHEVDAVLAARIRGESDDAIRQLVAKLEAARKGVAA